MVVTVRGAERRDGARIVAMAHALSAHEGRGACRLTVEHLERYCFCENPLFFVLVAEDEDRRVGYALFYPTFDSEAAEPGLWMGDLFVEPAARRRGVGRALMAALARECRARGGCWIAWQVMRTNDTAVGFYDAVGVRDEDLSYWTAIGDLEAAVRG